MNEPTKCWSCHHRTAERSLGSHEVCELCYRGLKDYRECMICKEVLPDNVVDYALKEFQRASCGRKSCHKKRDVLYGYLCCDKAKYIQCVCQRAYKCPVHGTKHVGTHD